MATSAFIGTDKHAADGASPRSRRPATSSWLPYFVFLFGVMLVSLLASRELTGRASSADPWMLVPVLALIGWYCPIGIAMGIGVLALIPGAWMDWQTRQLLDCFAVQLVRWIVAIGLMTWIGRLKQRLIVAERLSRIDSLTGLPNRQALIESLEAELSRAKRFGRPFSLAMFDCDGFKGINDESGHLAGDEVLRQIGESLRQTKRPFDCAGRWGGDEFLIVLSEADQTDAEILADRLRAAIRHDVERKYPRLTFSLGVVTFLSARPNWQECLQAVDAAMYEAKRTGRDETRFVIVE